MVSYMKKFIFALLFCVTSLTGCYASYNLGEGDVTVISPQTSPSMILDHEQPDESAVISVQSEWEKAQENIIPTETTAETSAVPEISRAEEILAEMSLEEKVGQIIFARYGENAADDMAKYRFGGYTLYAADFEGETPESITDELSAAAAGNPIMPFFAADEEGGSVTRVSRYSAFADEKLPSVQQALGKGISMDEWTARMAAPLKKAGINLNFAPVADVALSKEDYIYYRTVGLDYAETGEVIAEIVTGMNNQGIVGCLKHFPGYGSNVDTHTGIAVDERSAEDFRKKDFLPFIAGIEAGSPMVMVNHNIVTAFNGDVPASLAPEVHEELRNLGFEGIIITDDLGMDAITLYSDAPYVQAVLAGNDMLCTSNGASTYEAVYSAVLDGTITEDMLDEKVLRILNVKLRFGIIE